MVIFVINPKSPIIKVRRCSGWLQRFTKWTESPCNPPPNQPTKNKSNQELRRDFLTNAFYYVFMVGHALGAYTLPCTNRPLLVRDINMNTLGPRLVRYCQCVLPQHTSPSYCIHVQACLWQSASDMWPINIQFCSYLQHINICYEPSILLITFSLATCIRHLIQDIRRFIQRTKVYPNTQSKTQTDRMSDNRIRILFILAFTLASSSWV